MDIQRLAIVLTLCFAGLLRAEVSIQGASGLIVRVTTTGIYTVTVPTPAWKFSGATGVAVTNLKTSSGSDGAGPFNEISFSYTSGGPRGASIRAYTNREAVIFSLTYNSATSNVGYFPALSIYPHGLHHIAFQGAFAQPSFSVLKNDSPWFFFDSSANTFAISAASHYMQGYVGYDAASDIVSGIDPAITSLPQGFTQQTVLVIGRGINKTFQAWGRLLTSLEGKAAPPNDQGPILGTLGYWTDHFSAYWYATEPGKSYEQTMYDVKADLVNRGIPAGYMQLDSWFYPKGPQADWTAKQFGIYRYEAAPELFPDGLSAFQRKLGLPLVTHARWIDPSSPYNQQYIMSGSVITDPLYWNAIATELAGAGVVTYEQDWLSSKAVTNFNLTDPDAFLGNMASAMQAQNLSIQYCMGAPRHFLQSAQYANVTNIRCSLDGFTPSLRTPFLYTSTLASALGLWPFADVLPSSWLGGLILSTLSAGPVAFGDAVGVSDAAHLQMAARADGVLVKPDVPITPLDSTFIHDAVNAGRPVIASTYTDFAGLRPHYVYAYPEGSNVRASFGLGELGITGSAYVYNFTAGTGRVVTAGAPVTDVIAGEYLYDIVSPIGPSGIAMLGDLGNLTPLGKKRISSLSDNGVVAITVEFAGGEAQRTITGYAPTEPSVSAVSGGVGNLNYDQATGLFRFTVSVGGLGSASVVVTPN